MGNDDIALLKCTSSYPAPIDEANISMIHDFSEKFGVITGLSDHTIGNVVPVVAVSLGARIIEKHFILDKSIGGPDASFSLDESEFSQMVSDVRKAESALGSISYELTEKQINGKQFSRSLYITSDVLKGDILNENNVRSIRPGFGLHPKYLPSIIGKRFVRYFERGTPLTLDKII